MKKQTPKKFIKKKAEVVYTIIPAKKPNLKLEFPNIHRFITERKVSLPALDSIFVVSFISGMLLMGIGLASWRLMQDTAAFRRVEASYQTTKKDLAYWREVTREKPDYRDGYYQSALLALKLGDREKAIQFLEQALVIDPNFEAGNTVLRELKKN